MNVLSSITADVIKLDKEFLQYTDRQQSYEFVSHLIGLMKHMGMSVLAEGGRDKGAAGAAARGRL